MKRYCRLLILLPWLFVVPNIFAAPADKPFAVEKVVLQISDDDAYKQALVLNVASNLLKHYGPDKVDVEIVAFGPGMRLLFKENANASRITALGSSGVRFAACQNTIEVMAKQLGYTPALQSIATPVSAGVVRIIELENLGFKLIKP